MITSYIIINILFLLPFILLLGLTIFAIFHAFLKKSYIWLLCIIFFPGIGAFLYLLPMFMRKKIEREYKEKQIIEKPVVGVVVREQPMLESPKPKITTSQDVLTRLQKQRANS
ncbi:PLD nuclease N-terminal domain-containing protein [Beggiatoa leptomitoformis]|uniref:Uncharacterized protein n=1 Tax=Beggiatoa leptomitoformis TaxID=288004 RepID=A0A2N9YEJ6_9GAMM|nr:PLD nuclease N-terminal domain-containing protein [Beggiatoa leptomitoformis]ALG68724.1 hypothetical protein AL038_14740 [Beggiatoa leptomitoformis]AUI68921.1 hypothetical protein BLE401_09525 [Beggiatoa leptomitoformis]